MCLLPVLLGVPWGLSLMLEAYHKPRDLPYSPCPGWRSAAWRENPPLMKHEPSEHQQRRPKARGWQRNWRRGGSDPVAFIFLQLLVQLDFVIFHLCFWLFMVVWMDLPLGNSLSFCSHTLFFGSGTRIPGPGSCFDGPFWCSPDALYLGPAFQATEHSYPLLFRWLLAFPLLLMGSHGLVWAYSSFSSITLLGFRCHKNKNTVIETTPGECTTHTHIHIHIWHTCTQTHTHNVHLHILT